MAENELLAHRGSYLSHKLAIHRQELYDKTVGAKDEGTGRNKSRGVAPQVALPPRPIFLIATDLPLSTWILGSTVKRSQRCMH